MEIPSPPPGKPALRASDADRERVAGILQRNFTDGRLTYGELQEGLEQTYAARTLAQLDTLTEDLPAERRSGSSAVPTRQPRPNRRARRDRPRYNSIATYLVFCLFWVAIWAVSGHGSFWPIWPIMVFGVITALRFVRTF